MHKACDGLPNHHQHVFIALPEAEKQVLDEGLGLNVFRIKP